MGGAQNQSSGGKEGRGEREESKKQMIKQRKNIWP